MNARRSWPWLLPVVLTLLFAPCLALASLGSTRLDLFHAAFHNSCAIRTYQVHWQDQRHYPDTFRYDFSTSPDSIVFVTLWIEDGPTFNFSHSLPVDCSP